MSNAFIYGIFSYFLATMFNYNDNSFSSYVVQPDWNKLALM